MKNWSRGDVIALLGLVIAIAATIATIIVIPEVRNYLGLADNALEQTSTTTITPDLNATAEAMMVAALTDTAPTTTMTNTPKPNLVEQVFGTSFSAYRDEETVCNFPININRKHAEKVLARIAGIDEESAKKLLTDIRGDGWEYNSGAQKKYENVRTPVCFPIIIDGLPQNTNEIETIRNQLREDGIVLWVIINTLSDAEGSFAGASALAAANKCTEHPHSPLTAEEWLELVTSLNPGINFDDGDVVIAPICASGS